MTNRKEPTTMGKHEKKPEQVAVESRVRAESERPAGGKHAKTEPPRLSDLVRELREMGERLGVKVEPHFVKLSDLGIDALGEEPCENGTCDHEDGQTKIIHSSKYPGSGSSWGSIEHVQGKNGEHVHHICQVLADAAESDLPAEFWVNNGQIFGGRVLSVSPELVAIEQWQRTVTPEGKVLTSRPESPNEVYLDIAAIDAVVKVSHVEEEIE